MSSRQENDALVKDPHADREAERYENPIPSRELILEVLNQHDKLLTLPQLIAHFRFFDDPEREEALRRRLGAMVRDGQLDCNRRGAYSPISEDDLIQGRVQGHPDGFGFLIPTDGTPDLLLTSKQMRLVYDGDIAVVRVGGYDHKGRREGIVVRVLERKTTTVVGRFYEENGVTFVRPDNRRMTQEVLIEGDVLGATVGQFVTVEMLTYPSHRSVGTGKVVEVLGDYMAPGMEIDIAIRSYDIPHIWPADVESAAAVLSTEVAEADKKGRVDLRDLPLMTIDGEDARDFDDAVYAEKRRGGGYRLVVAIADVSHYVKEGSALDIEAKARGNSVYFPDFVVPMLPEVLSNGLCSLNPHVDRLCMVCDMNISAAGRVTAYKFYEAVMHSQARLTYNKVSTILEHAETPEAAKLRDQYAHILKPLNTLFELFQILRTVREARGALDFDSQETRILFGHDRKIEKIVPVTRNKAHMLIEEMMLAANVCSASFAEKRGVPVLYRNHEGPRDEKLSKLKNYLGAIGIGFTASKKPQPADFQAVLEAIQGRPDASIIQTMLLRSLSQAVYSPDNVGHFGLAYKAYSHFTSPIRRYPDLLLHRAIRQMLKNEPAEGEVVQVERPVVAQKEQAIADVKIQGLGEHCSMTERRADEATRDVVAWLKCEYMQDRVGADFDGVITAVTSFGIFVELKDIFVEGLVHVSRLHGDYYQFDPVMNRLSGERSGVSFALGDSVRVKVAAVNLDDRKIDFELIGGGARRKASSTRERLASGDAFRKEAKSERGSAKKDSAKKDSAKKESAKKSGAPASKSGGKSKSSDKPKTPKARSPRKAPPKGPKKKSKRD